MRMLTKRQKTGFLWVTTAIVLIAIVSGLTLYVLPLVSQRASLFGTGQILAAGQAVCPGAANPAGGYASTSPPTGCLNTSQFLQVNFVDAGNTATKLSGWSADLLSVGGPLALAPAGSTIDSCTNTGANGQCTFNAQQYPPGMGAVIWLCHGTSACGSGDYSAKETTYQIAFPGLPGLAGGTVPFFPGTTNPTSTPTTQFFLPILMFPGDASQANSATPYTLGNLNFNGTSIPTGTTCFISQAKGTNTCYLGASQTQANINFILTNTNTAGTIPYASGFTPTTKLDIPNRGQLTQAMTMEVKQTSGSDPVCSVTSSSTFPTSPTATKQGSVPDVFYVTGDQSASLKNQVQNGPLIVSSGQATYSFAINCASMTTSGDQTTFTLNLYVNFSLTFFTGNGASVNVEAFTNMSQYQIIFKK